MKQTSYNRVELGLFCKLYKTTKDEHRTVQDLRRSTVLSLISWARSSHWSSFDCTYWNTSYATHFMPVQICVRYLKTTHKEVEWKWYKIPTLVHFISCAKELWRSSNLNRMKRHQTRNSGTSFTHEVGLTCKVTNFVIVNLLTNKSSANHRKPCIGHRLLRLPCLCPLSTCSHEILQLTGLVGSSWNVMSVPVATRNPKSWTVFILYVRSVCWKLPQRPPKRWHVQNVSWRHRCHKEGYGIYRVISSWVDWCRKPSCR